MQGKIIGNISNKYKIETNQGEYEAYARGKLKKEEITPLVGDKVEIEITDESKKEAIIEKIEERKNELKRPKIANIDQIIFIISTKQPQPSISTKSTKTIRKRPKRAYQPLQHRNGFWRRLWSKSYDEPCIYSSSKKCYISKNVKRCF